MGLKIAIALFAALIAFRAEGQANEEATVVLDPSVKRQTMDGFGASGAWWSKAAGGMPDRARELIAELLFDRQRGAGLSIYRYNLGAGDGADITDDWRRTRSLETTPGSFDWANDADALWFVKKAAEYDVENIVAFVNSPPARLTKNGRVSGGTGGGSNLGADEYEAYGAYLAGALKTLVSHGYRIDWLSPVNEPDVPWNGTQGQEGCSYTPEEAAALFAAIAPVLEAELPSVKIVGPECGKWDASRDYFQAFSRNGPAMRSLAKWAVHSYWSSMVDRMAAGVFLKSRAPELGVWMSEYCRMEGGAPDLSMRGALQLANTLVEDVIFGRASSWQWWIAVSKYDYQDGLIYVDPGFSRVSTAKRLWALGNWARWVRPGFVSIAASSDRTDVASTAFLSPDSSTMVAVLVNNAPRPVAVNMSVPSGYRLDAVYETSARSDLSRISRGGVTLPGESIDTFIWKRGRG